MPSKWTSRQISVSKKEPGLSIDRRAKKRKPSTEMNRRSKSPRSEDGSEKLEEAVEDTRRFIDKAIGEIGEKAALQQLLLGSVTGW